jgi:hypothetical protein
MIVMYLILIRVVEQLETSIVLERKYHILLRVLENEVYLFLLFSSRNYPANRSQYLEQLK